VPQQYIDFAYVKENASFERVIAGYNLKLLGSGVQRAMLCPFHRERKASCKLDMERKIFHCFGCGAKGNILEFVARLEGDADDLRAAAIKVAELCGIATAPPRESNGGDIRGSRGPRRPRAAKAWSRPEPGKPAKSRAVAVQPGAEGVAVGANDNAVASGDAVEPTNPPLTFALRLDPDHPYLAERGLSAAIVAEFGLGLCNRGSMAGRICIPIHDHCGQLVAYAGRWPGDDDIPEGEDRYKLPAKFQKNRVLFNLHRIVEAEHIVLVEGYWSAMRLHALGVPAVAFMGSSVSPEQLALLRGRGTRVVTALLDGDAAGRAARERALPDLASRFFVRAPLLPQGEKPDTLQEALLLELVSSPFS
jgi:DNA primase